MYARLPALLVLAQLFAAVPSVAQSTGEHPSPADSGATRSTPTTPLAIQAYSPNRLSAWIGGSFATGGPIGNIRQAQLRLLGLRYERLLVPAPPNVPTDGPTLTYTADMFPVLHLTVPPEAISIPLMDTESSTRNQGLNTYGVGVSPAGLRITYRVVKRVQPVIAGSASIVYFTESVPSKLGKQLNFTFDLGVGVQIVLTSDLLLTAGYRYHHLSNGFRGQINPGVDANLLHFGVGVSR